VWSRWTIYPLPYYSVFCCGYIILRCGLTFDPVTLNIYSVSHVTWWNSAPSLNAIEQSAAELMRHCDINIWLNDLERRALGSEIIFTEFDLRQLIANYSVLFHADTLCHAVTLTFDLLTLNFYSTLRPTQPFIASGSVNECQLRLGRQRQVWFIPLADERGVCR